MVDPAVPWESHYIFGSGWVGVYVVYSENGRDTLYCADTMNKAEILADLGPAIWGRVVDTLGKAPERVLNSVKAQRGAKAPLRRRSGLYGDIKVIYIGVGDVPILTIRHATDLIGWDIEYDGQGYLCKWKVMDVLEFSVYPTPDQKMNEVKLRKLPRNLVFVCDYPVTEGGQSRDGYAWWVKDKPGLLQNFRKAWEAPAATKWAEGGTSLPEGGLEETNWFTEYRAALNGTVFWVYCEDAMSAVIDVEQGRKVMLRQ